MAETIKILGQAAPNATSETELYLVTSGKSASISSIVVCNRGSASGTFRVSVSVAGATTTNKDYLYYDQYIDANSTYIATVGITLASTDKVRVYASSANFSFNIFGIEVS